MNERTYDLINNNNLQKKVKKPNSYFRKLVQRITFSLKIDAENGFHTFLDYLINDFHVFVIQ